MDYKELLISFSLLIFISVLYILIRKFIFWTIKDDQKFRKKQGAFGLDKEGQKAVLDIPLFKLNCIYVLLMVLILIYIIKLFFSKKVTKDKGKRQGDGSMCCCFSNRNGDDLIRKEVLKRF